MSALDRTPDSKISLAFQLEKEFPEFDWRDGVCGELIDMFVADRLCARIIDEMIARDMWKDYPFGEFFGVK